MQKFNPMRFALIFMLFTLVGCQLDKKGTQETIESKPLEVSDNEIVNYISYCNDRFDVCFDYPSNFNAQPEPANGDGRTFRNEIDSSEITLYGYLDQENEGLEGQIELYKNFLDIQKMDEIKNGIEIIGKNKDNGFIHKERIYIKPDSKAGTYENGDPMNVIYSLQFTYPEDKSQKYKSYWSKMVKKLK